MSQDAGPGVIELADVTKVFKSGEVAVEALRGVSLAVSEQDEQAARGWMESHGRDTHPPHRYRAEDYGITRDQIARAFEFYDERFLRRR